MPESLSFYPHKLKGYRYDFMRKTNEKSGNDLVDAINEMIADIKKRGFDQASCFQEFIKTLEGMIQEVLNKKKGKKREYDPFDIKRSGDARIALFGMTNVGKSTLMNAITNSKAKTGNYSTTTTTALGGTCFYSGVQIQIVDLPGFVEFNDDWKINKQIRRVSRTSDAVLMVIDLSTDVEAQYHFLLTQLEKAKIIIEGESVFRIQIIATKGDLSYSKEHFDLLKSISEYNILPTTIKDEQSLDSLKKGLFELLEIMKIYTKRHHRKPNLDSPMVVPIGATVGDIAKKIHRDFFNNFDHAKIWGDSAEFDGQHVSFDHVLMDNDIVEVFAKSEK
jgi:small GTP-binding protein